VRATTGNRKKTGDGRVNRCSVIVGGGGGAAKADTATVYFPEAGPRVLWRLGGPL